MRKKFLQYSSFVAIFLFVLPVFAFADPTLRESSDTTNNDTSGFFDTTYYGCTFTTTAEHSITSFKFKLKTGTAPNPDLIYGVVKATDAGLPTGTALATGNIDGDILTGSYAWVEIPVTEILLQDATQYAIYVYTNTSTSQHVGGTSGNPYAGGNTVYSTDSGTNWTSAGTYDCIFEIWGNDTVETPPVVPGSATSSSAQTYGDWLFMNSVQTFLLSFIGIGLVFSVFRKKK